MVVVDTDGFVNLPPWGSSGVVSSASYSRISKDVHVPPGLRASSQSRGVAAGVGEAARLRADQTRRASRWYSPEARVHRVVSRTRRPRHVLIRRLRAILNMYPPNRSVQRRQPTETRPPTAAACPEAPASRNITMSTTPSGTNDAIPCITPMNRSLDARIANGMESSWKDR